MGRFSVTKWAMAAMATVPMSSTALAQAEPGGSDPASLIGDWSGDCDAWGTAATCRSSWSQGLHDDLLVQEYSISNTETGAQIFSGRGVYRIRGGNVDGYWEDSQGAIHPLTGDWTDGVLSVMWGTPATQLGRSRYEAADGQLLAADWGLSEAGWRPFMEVVYEPAAQ